MPPDTLFVLPDTNLFLHYKKFSDSAWVKFFPPNRKIMILLSGTTLRELDKKKNDLDSSVRNRAKKIVRWIKDRHPFPAELENGLHLSIELTPPTDVLARPGLDRYHNDDVFVAEAIMASESYGINNVAVLTHDMYPRFKADSYQLAVYDPPDSARVPDEESTQIRSSNQAALPARPILTISPLVIREKLADEFLDVDEEEYIRGRLSANDPSTDLIGLHPYTSTLAIMERERRSKESELRKAYQQAHQISRTIRLALELENEGGPASEILLSIRAPQGVTFAKHGVSIPAHVRDIPYIGWICEGRSATLNIPSIVHGIYCSLPPLYAVFDKVPTSCSFDIKIAAKELQPVRSCKVSLVVEGKQSFLEHLKQFEKSDQ